MATGRGAPKEKPGEETALQEEAGSGHHALIPGAPDTERGLRREEAATGPPRRQGKSNILGINAEGGRVSAFSHLSFPSAVAHSRCSQSHCWGSWGSVS